MIVIEHPNPTFHSKRKYLIDEDEDDDDDGAGFRRGHENDDNTLL